MAILRSRYTRSGRARKLPCVVVDRELPLRLWEPVLTKHAEEHLLSLALGGRVVRVPICEEAAKQAGALQASPPDTSQHRAHLVDRCQVPAKCAVDREIDRESAAHRGEVEDRPLDSRTGMSSTTVISRSLSALTLVYDEPVVLCASPTRTCDLSDLHDACPAGPRVRPPIDATQRHDFRLPSTPRAGLPSKIAALPRCDIRARGVRPIVRTARR